MTDDYCAGSKIAPRQTFAGAPLKVPWRMGMSEPLRLTIVYADDGDGWAVAPILRSGAQSAGSQPDEEPRNNVIAMSSSPNRKDPRWPR